MIRTLALSCVMLASCAVPDTQPVIDGVMEWKRIEDAELAKHRTLATAAKFSNDPEQQTAMMAQYLSLLNKHQETSDRFATKIADWARTVGQFDPAYADKKIAEMLQMYNQIKGQ